MLVVHCDNDALRLHSPVRGALPGGARISVPDDARVIESAEAAASDGDDEGFDEGCRMW